MKTILRLAPVFALALFSGNSFATKLTLTALGGMQMNNSNEGKIELYDVTGYTDGTALSQFGFQAGGGLGLEFTNFGFRGMAMYQQSASTKVGVFANTSGVKQADTSTSWTDIAPGGDIYFITGDPKKGFRFIIGAGGEVHLAKYRMQYTPVSGFSDTLVASGTGFGAKGFIGFNIMFSENVGLVAEGGYRYAMVNELKASENYYDTAPNISSGSVIKKYVLSPSGYTGDTVKLDLSAPYLQTGLVFKF